MASAGAIATASNAKMGDEPLFVFGRERRMHARAYDYWVSLLHGRRMPRVTELDPDQLSDFSERSVMVDLPASGDAPTIAFLGRALRDEAGVAPVRPTIDDVPQGTLLAELLRRFPDIVAYRAPVGFEAEFAGPAGGRLLHRGILLPFSNDHGALTSVYGVMSWKQLAVVEPAPDIAAALGSVMALRSRVATISAWGDGPGASLAAEALPPQPLDQRLAVARTWAALAATDHRHGGARIHAALGAAYDYFLGARDHAPLTARKVVALIFGASLGRLDRVRYAATLDHASRLGLSPGRVAAWLDNREGGYIAAASAERAARRAGRRAAEAAEAGTRHEWAEAQAALGHIELTAVDEDFLLLIGRRAQRGVEGIAPVPADALFTGAALARARRG